mgnify:CR=1 FL=1
MARDTLDTLIRLADAEIDTARLALQKVLAEEDAVREKLNELAVQVEHECAAGCHQAKSRSSQRCTGGGVRQSEEV